MLARKAASATCMTLVLGSLQLLGGQTATAEGATSNNVTTSSLGEAPPTFVGLAATGCPYTGCQLLSGPYRTPSTESLTPSAARAAVEAAAASPLAQPAVTAPRPKVMPNPRPPRPAGPDPSPPGVSCQPLGAGCDSIRSSSGGAVGVKGLNTVDSSTQSPDVAKYIGDIEPADQGLCAGNGYVVETNNLGEVLIFNKNLQRLSSVIPLDTIMGLQQRGWSSGGDVSCLYDPSNGGHFFFTQFVSANTYASGGPFTGCFAGQTANQCYEGIAVSVGPNPFGPYNVYFFNANYNPKEPGYPYLLNDFAKIATTKDAFLLFYDEFPTNGNYPGLGGGGFNGSQQIAINKNALEWGEPVTFWGGEPNPFFTVAIENMGLLPTPDGTCFSDNTYHLPGFTCWYQDIPAQTSDASQFDNSHFGSGFIMGSLDFYGRSDTRIAVFDWTGLANLNSPDCFTCGGIRFGGQLFSGVQLYYGEGFIAAQKSGPIPLGDECGAAGWSVAIPPATTPPASCPEGGIATNGDGFTQVSQAQNKLWGAISTEISQSFASGSEVHQGAAYWVIDTDSFDRKGVFGLATQGYVSPAHEDLEFPAMAAAGSSGQDGNSQGGNGQGCNDQGGNSQGGNGQGGNDQCGSGGAIITFTLSGNGGPTGADNGGFYPSTAYGWVTSWSSGLVGSVVRIADLGQSPQDGFTEYDGYPGPTRPRWGDYSWAIWSDGKFYFATNYIQYPNCTGADFDFTKLGTCGGTRDGNANWGTSVNYVEP
jgi:hypothetical protein